jgi:hypothetical protein
MMVVTGGAGPVRDGGGMVVENGIPALKVGGGRENGGGGLVKSISTAGLFALNSKGVLGAELKTCVH